MDVARRTVVKGMLAAGALLAAARPRWNAEADDTKASCVLVLGGSGWDARFADAAHEAAEIAVRPLRTFSIAAGDFDAGARLVAGHPGTRLVGIMDDAAYAVFHELVRSAGARLLYLGRHASGRESFGSRHGLVSTPTLAAVGATMARSFAESGCSVLMTESCLGAPNEGTAAWDDIPGFRSYDVGASEARRLHLSSVSAQEACALVGIDPACLRARPAVADVPAIDVVKRGWVPAIARSLITTLAARKPAAAVSGGQQMFLHRDPVPERADSGDGCVTFVIDV